MLDDIKEICGVYSRPGPSEGSTAAIKYNVALSTENGLHTLHIDTEYGDGRHGTKILSIQELTENERQELDTTLGVLHRLKRNWLFEPAFSSDELNPTQERVFQFSVDEEMNRFLTNSSIPTDSVPELVILAGGVCTGKSKMRHEEFADHVSLDAGEIFLNLSRGEYFEFGEVFNEPLEMIGGAIAQKAIRERRNVVTEIIGADPEATRRLIDAGKAAGYEPKINFLTCDLETAWERNVNRGNNISAHYCEPYHVRWLLNAFESASHELEEPEDDVDEPYFDGAFFPLGSGEEWVKHEIIGFVRKLMNEHHLSPETLRKTSILLLGLERLPRTTSGIDVTLTLIYRFGGESNYHNIELSETRFALSSGGNTYAPEVGSDSFSETLFECESTGFRDGSLDPWELGSWLLSALDLLNSDGELEIHEDSDAKSLPWDDENNRDPFEELEERIEKWKRYLDED